MSIELIILILIWMLIGTVTCFSIHKDEKTIAISSVMLCACLGPFILMVFLSDRLPEPRFKGIAHPLFEKKVEESADDERILN